MTPFVLMADMEIAVINVTAVVVKISNIACPEKIRKYLVGIRYLGI